MIGRGRQCEQRKKSAYIGKRRFRRGLGLFGLEAQNLHRGTGSTQVGFGAEIGKGLDVGKFLPFTSTLTKIV
jgi:hypothetical protein